MKRGLRRNVCVLHAVRGNKNNRTRLIFQNTPTFRESYETLTKHDGKRGESTSKRPTHTKTKRNSVLRLL